MLVIKKTKNIYTWSTKAWILCLYLKVNIKNKFHITSNFQHKLSMDSQNRFFNLSIAVWHAVFKTVDCTLVINDSRIQCILTRMCTNFI